VKQEKYITGAHMRTPNAFVGHHSHRPPHGAHGLTILVDETI